MMVSRSGNIAKHPPSMMEIACVETPKTVKAI